MCEAMWEGAVGGGDGEDVVWSQEIKRKEGKYKGHLG